MFCARCKPHAQGVLERLSRDFDNAMAAASYHRKPEDGAQGNEPTAAERRDINIAEQEHRSFGFDSMDVDSDGNTPGHKA